MWQLGEATVATEHNCTAAAQLIMSQLYPRIFSTPRNGLSLIASCVGGECHQVGVRMVADLFELDGWDTSFLGADLPTESLVATVREQRPELLCLSATMTRHVDHAREVIRQLRREPECAGTRLMVGGAPFRLAPGLWREVGADCHAPDAASSVQIGREAVGR